MDTGLCRDYFKAHDAVIRGGGLDLKSLEVRIMRVRGWVENKNRALKRPTPDRSRSSASLMEW